MMWRNVIVGCFLVSSLVVFCSPRLLYSGWCWAPVEKNCTDLGWSNCYSTCDSPGWECGRQTLDRYSHAYGGGEPTDGDGWEISTAQSYELSCGLSAWCYCEVVGFYENCWEILECQATGDQGDDYGDPLDFQDVCVSP
jgi:hypothetical protein